MIPDGAPSQALAQLPANITAFEAERAREILKRDRTSEQLPPFVLSLAESKDALSHGGRELNPVGCCFWVDNARQ